MNKFSAAAAVACISVLLLAGCSSAPATPVAKPAAVVTTEAPTPTPTPTATVAAPTMTEAAYLALMHPLYSDIANDFFLTQIGKTRCGELDLGTTPTEIKANEAETGTTDAATVEIGIRAAIDTYCPKYADITPMFTN